MMLSLSTPPIYPTALATAVAVFVGIAFLTHSGDVRRLHAARRNGFDDTTVSIIRAQAFASLCFVIAQVISLCMSLYRIGDFNDFGATGRAVMSAVIALGMEFLRRTYKRVRDNAPLD